jgi:hypothetical protein
MHPAIKPDPHHLGDTAGIVAIGLVDLRLQHRSHVPRLNTDYRQLGFGERTEQPLRQRSSFQSDPLEVVGRIPQNRPQSVGLARDLHLAHNLARTIHNAETETSSPAKWSMLRFS